MSQVSTKPSGTKVTSLGLQNNLPWLHAIPLPQWGRGWTLEGPKAHGFGGLSPCCNCQRVEGSSCLWFSQGWCYTQLALQFLSLGDNPTSVTPRGTALMGTLCSGSDPMILQGIGLIKTLQCLHPRYKFLPCLSGCLLYLWKSRWRRTCTYISCII